MFEDNADFDDDIQLNFPSDKDKKVTSTKRLNDSVRFEPFRKTTPIIRKNAVNLLKNVAPRKFPGPAGLLPDRKNLSSTSLLENLNAKNRNEDIIPCSQTSSSVFQHGPWLEMSNEYNNLVDMYHIKWIKMNASRQRLNTEKAPFLGAIIQNIECLDEKNPVVNVILKDVTGEIQGTIMYKLYEEYSDNLVAGSVIVLQQFGVLTTGANNHYLTITSKNLVAIYSENKENEIVVNKLQVLKTGEREIESRALRLESPPIQQVDEKITLSCSQTTVNVSKDESAAWENAFEGVDADSFFEDF